jgi:hypothetical protein
VPDQYFTTRRGLAVGIVASGISLRAALFAFVLRYMFKDIGFQSTLLWALLMPRIPHLLVIVLIPSPTKLKGGMLAQNHSLTLKYSKNGGSCCPRMLGGCSSK